MSNPTLVHGKRQSLGKTIWKHRASYLLMAPYFILFFFFTVLPVLMAIGVSFTDWNMLEKPEFVGWQNYVKLLLDDEIFIISLSLPARSAICCACCSRGLSTSSTAGCARS